jgi:hypothetical protein
VFGVVLCVALAATLVSVYYVRRAKDVINTTDSGSDYDAQYGTLSIT